MTKSSKLQLYVHVRASGLLSLCVLFVQAQAMAMKVEAEKLRKKAEEEAELMKREAEKEALRVKKEAQRQAAKASEKLKEEAERKAKEAEQKIGEEEQLIGAATSIQVLALSFYMTICFSSMVLLLLFVSVPLSLFFYFSPKKVSLCLYIAQSCLRLSICLFSLEILGTHISVRICITPGINTNLSRLNWNTSRRPGGHMLRACNYLVLSARPAPSASVRSARAVRSLVG